MRVCPECFQLCGPDRKECDRDGAKLSHYTQVLIGLQLGPYIVRSMVSEGGMGVVYLAEHPALGRQVAIKVLRPELSLRDDIVERFTQEARAVNTIQHTNIVKIYDFGKTPFGSFYIVMEYLNGMTVRTLLDETGPQPLERIRFIVTQVAAALEAAHNKGFVHRDVKPANIMLCQRARSETIKLLDFGIAKLVTSAEKTTDHGLTLGTPQYMAPEQLEEGTADRRTDIYAIGVVAYELLTGQVPYSGASQAAVRHAQSTYRPQPPSQCRRDIRLSPQIDRVVFRAIAPMPAERYQRVDNFLVAFRAACQDTIGLMALQQAARGRPLSRRLPLVAASLVILAVLGALAGMLLRARPTPSPTSKVLTRSASDQHLQRGTAAGARHVPSTGSHPRSPSGIVRAALTATDRLKRRAILRQMSEVCSERLRPLLIQALGDEDSIVRRLAAQTLGALGTRDAETMRALRAGLAQQMSFSAIAYAKALVQLGDKNAIFRLRRELLLAQRRGPQAVRYALEALAERDKSAARRLAPFARAAGWADRPALKARLLREMARAGIRRARSQLYRAAIRQPSEKARLHAASALAALGDQRAMAPLRRLCQSATEAIRAQAAATLLRHGDVNSAESLLELLHSADTEARALSALGLASARTRDSWSGQLRVLAKRRLMDALADTNDEVSSAAAVALLAF